MDRIKLKYPLLMIVLVLNFSCSSVYKVKVVEIEDWDESELSYILIQKLNTSDNRVFELPTYKDDSIFIPIKKISLGDEVKLKLLKKQNLRMTKITAEDRVYIDSTGNAILRVNQYYSPDIQGLYYVRIRN